MADKRILRSRLAAVVTALALIGFRAAAAADVAPSQVSPVVAYTGVNLAGAEFNGGRLPGRPNFDYVYPNAREVAYFAGKGANIVRLPVLWERLQPVLSGKLDRGELDRVRATVKLADEYGLSVVIDLHGYGRYRGEVIGTDAVPVAAFRNVWSQLAAEFAGNDRVVFGLMNEPVAMTPAHLLDAVNSALDGIRSAGARNLVLVPGAGWSGAHDFVSVSGKTLAGVRDLGRNFAFEAHQYLDPDNSGTHWTCRDAKAAVDALTPMTAWLRTHRARGFVGEFGVADNPQCLKSLDAMLNYMAANSDVWTGWTYWAAGAWWGDYPMSVEPRNGKDREQLEVLIKYFHNK